MAAGSPLAAPSGPGHRPPMIDGVLFDKDGCLFGFQETWAPWAARMLRGIAGDDAHTRVLAEAVDFDLDAVRFRPESPVIAGTAEEQVRLLLPHLPGWDAPRLRAHLTDTAARADPVPVTDLPALVRALRARGLALGVATNGAEAEALRQTAAVGLGGAFDFVAGYDSGYGAKPAPGMLLAFCEAAGVAPAATVMVGDSTHDLFAARAAGMVGVGVLTGPAGREGLAPHAAAVLESIADLPDWLDGRA